MLPNTEEIMIKSINEMFQSIDSIKYYVESIDPIIKQRSEEFKNKLSENQVDDTHLRDKIKIIQEYIKELNPETDLQDDSVEEAMSKKIISKLLEKGFVVEGDIENDEEEITTTIKNYKNIERQKKFLINNAIVNGVMAYEQFVREVFSIHYRKHPDTIVNSKSIAVTDLRKFDSFDSAYEYLISEEITEHMYAGIDKWMKILKDKIGISNSHYTDNNKTIKEIFLRRNVIIHNSAITNGIYVKESDNPFKFKINEEIISSYEYVMDSLDLLLTNAVFLFIKIWIKNSKGDLADLDKENDGTIGSIAFHFLSKEKWAHAKTIYEELYNSKRIKDLSIKMYRLNILLCKRFLGEDGIQELIDKEDFSASGDFLKVGIYALQRNYDELKRLLETPSNKEIGTKQIKSWPIFHEVREDETLLKEILEICEKNKSKSYKLKV